jgi:hypothetical protein
MLRNGSDAAAARATVCSTAEPPVIGAFSGAMMRRASDRCFERLTLADGGSIAGRQN